MDDCCLFVYAKGLKYLILFFLLFFFSFFFFHFLLHFFCLYFFCSLLVVYLYVLDRNYKNTKRLIGNYIYDNILCIVNILFTYLYFLNTNCIHTHIYHKSLALPWGGGWNFFSFVHFFVFYY